MIFFKSMMIFFQVLQNEWMWIIIRNYLKITRSGQKLTGSRKETKEIVKNNAIIVDKMTGNNSKSD